MTSAHQPSRLTLDQPEDIIRFAISKEFLSPLEQVMFASSMAPLNDASNNQHISYLSKQLIMDSKTKLVSLDLTVLGDNLLARMTDVDLYRILRCVHLYVHTFRLGNCINVQGWGLAPLKHSTQLQNMDMSKIASGECQLQEMMTLPILHSIINTLGINFRVVQFPVDWRVKGKENKLLHSFLLAFDEKLCDRHLHCSGCNYCIDSDESDMYASKDELKYFGEGKDTYGLQQFVCYECSDVTCDIDDCFLDRCKVCKTVACQEKCSKMKWCEGCGGDYCTSCKDVLDCMSCGTPLCRDCCSDIICSYCGNSDCCEGKFYCTKIFYMISKMPSLTTIIEEPLHCSECGKRSCDECFEVRWCDQCESGHCMDCNPIFMCDECEVPSCMVVHCSDCDKASCRSCSKVLPCMSPRCDDFHCYECLTSKCSDGLMGLMVNHALSALMESLVLEVRSDDGGNASGSKEEDDTEDHDDDA